MTTSTAPLRVPVIVVVAALVGPETVLPDRRAAQALRADE
jgi:hypothetical protein